MGTGRTRRLTPAPGSATTGAMRAPQVFTISPALPFLETFVDSFFAGEIVAGVGPGLELADATIYVPTQRAAQELGETILRRRGGASAVLPRILPLGALEGTEATLLLTEPDPLAAGLPLPPAASPVWRRLRLGVLIQSWAQSVAGALRRVGGDGVLHTDPTERFRVATSAVDAFALAGELADLIDELRIEGIAWHELDDLAMAGFDDYWRLTTHFLSIAFEAWPRVLAEAGLLDPSARQMALVEAQTRQLREGHLSGPVVAIGSTGTSRATAQLLAAIASAPAGAVVLPGLDRELDEAAWSLVAGASPAGPGGTAPKAADVPCFTHPQAALARLLPILRVRRQDVRDLGTPEPARATRARFVAEALRPADTTDQWRGLRKSLTTKLLHEALADVALIEAADERAEALAIAVALREVLERPHETAALITPDRELARRVRGELLRWDIEVDDSGGEPLANRPVGVLTRLLATAAAALPGPGAPKASGATELGALLAHPLTTFGRPRAEIARRAAQIDVAVLRVVPLTGRAPGDLFARAQALAGEPHAHPAQKRLQAGDWAAMADVFSRTLAALAPLALSGEQDLATWVDAHRAALAAVMAEGPEDELEALETLFDELADGATLRVDARGYGLLLDGLMRELVLRNTERPHPRLRILGLLEARLLTADLVVLGGLDETVWPPPARTDAFLNRPMRHDLGLTPPERRIGQTAHDFTQALGARRVILTRAEKRGGSPCVPSRFLLRLEALGGEAWTACRERGQTLLRLAALVDRPDKAPLSATRPRPRPDPALRPKALSVTQIETLRRDPYAIYAAHILKLAPLPVLPDDFDARDYGNRLHDVLHAFSHDPAAAADAPTRRAALLARLEDMFAADRADPAFGSFRWPLLLRSAELFLTFDAERRRGAREILTEIRGVMRLELADTSTFTLTARADRIDVDQDGAVTLIDYKTGQVPGVNEVEVGLAPQLTLEAAILMAGGFPAPPGGPIRATYVRLGGRNGGIIRELSFKDTPFEMVARRHLDGLRRLLSSYRAPQTGYPSRLVPKYARRDGDYDHLARAREWDLATQDEAQP